MSNDYILPLFKRSQVEWALWQAFHNRIFTPAPDMRPVFRTRIKRLLELDAKLVESEIGAHHAFVIDGAEGNGNDRSFSTYDAIYLGLALDFLDAGLNQQDVIFILQHCRNLLLPHLQKVLTYPKWKRSELLASNAPQAPTVKKDAGEFADLRTFICFYKHEFKDFHPTHEDSKQPMFVGPEICLGYKALSEYLEEETYRHHCQFVFEIWRLTTEIRDALKEAPLVKRGRKAKA